MEAIIVKHLPATTHKGTRLAVTFGNKRKIYSYYLLQESCLVKDIPVNYENCAKLAVELFRREFDIPLGCRRLVMGENKEKKLVFVFTEY